MLLWFQPHDYLSICGHEDFVLVLDMDDNHKATSFPYTLIVTLVTKLYTTEIHSLSDPHSKPET